MTVTFEIPINPIGQYTWYDGIFLLRPRCQMDWRPLSMNPSLDMINTRLLKEMEDEGIPLPPSEGWALTEYLRGMGWYVTDIEALPLLDGCRLDEIQGY